MERKYPPPYPKASAPARPLEEAFCCPNCGPDILWVKTVTHYMCLKCANSFLHDWALENGYATMKASTRGG